MLNTFPILLSFGLFAPFILRLVAGIYFIKIGKSHLKLSKHVGEEAVLAEKYKIKPGIYFVWLIAGVEIIGGIFLVIGLLTQLSSLILSILLITGLFLQTKESQIFHHRREFYILLLAICLSLVLTGAGLIGFDLPI